MNALQAIASSATATAMGQRLRLRASGADSSSVSWNIILHSSSSAEFDTAREDGGSCSQQNKMAAHEAAAKKFGNNYGFFGVGAGAGRAGAAPVLLGAGAAIPLSALYASTSCLVMSVP